MMRRLIAVLVVLAVATIVVSGCTATLRFPWAKAPTYRQTVLPFTGLEDPDDLAVDSAGNVYIADEHREKVENSFPNVTTRVIELPAGSNTQIVLPQFDHARLLPGPPGAVWAEDYSDPILVKLAPGSDTQTVLPIPDLGWDGRLKAMDAGGNAYGTDGGGKDPRGACCMAIHVLKWQVGWREPIVLPFTGIINRGELAVDSAGNVYVTDGGQVKKLAAGTDSQTVLPFTHLPRNIVGMAVDSAGNVFVVDAQQRQVLKLPAGADTPIVLPFTGLNRPSKVAVDAAGNVYVNDVGSHQVLKLEAA
jgi:DNA-binding beta-propeller fold protein YncE